MHPGPEQAYPHLGLGGFLKKVLKFEKSHFKNLWKGLKDDPKRLILGVDPLSTKMWNKILNRDDRALVNQLGGATAHDYQQAMSEGIDIGPGKQVQDVAGMIAGAIGGGAAASGLGAAASSASGAAIAPATQTAIGTATKLGTAYASGMDEPGGLTDVVRGFQSGPGEHLGQAEGLLRRFSALDDPYSYGLKGMEHMFMKPTGNAEGGRVPSKSPAQAKLMRAVAHGWKKPGGGPSRAVAKEFVAADKKVKGYQFGGLAEMIEKAKKQGMTPEQLAEYEAAQKEKEKAGLLQIYNQYGSMEPTGMFSNMLYNIGQKAGTRLSALEPVGGLEDATRAGGYAIPQPSTRTGTDFDPGSIAEEIYNKYGIIDPTWTNYDRTSQEAMKEDPLAHLPADDPARAEYEGWNQQREQQDQLREVIAYPEMAGKQSPQREQLRQHKARVSDILSGGGGGGNVVAGGTPGFYTEAPQLIEEEEPLEMQAGGLAQAMQRQRGSMGRRGSPQMQAAMQRPTRGGFRGRGPQRMPGGRRSPMRGNDARRPNPQMMNMMRQKMAQQRGGGRRGMVAPGMRGPMKQLGGPQPRPGMGGRVQPGGPGGMPGGRPEMLRPDDARMPGGRAMPFRGFQQKQSMQRRGNLGGNRVGPADQQGGLARAMQTQTGRPPISRRMGFPGRAR